MVSGDQRMNRLIERGRQFLGAAFKDSCPRGIQQDITDAGFTMQENRNSTTKGFKRWNSITLSGRHQEKMRLIVKRGELLVADKSGKRYAAFES